MTKLTFCCCGIILFLVACGAQTPKPKGNNEPVSESEALSARLMDSVEVRMHELLAHVEAKDPKILSFSEVALSRSAYALTILQGPGSDNIFQERIEKASAILARTDITDSLLRANAEWDLCSARAALAQRAALKPFLENKDNAVFRYVVKTEVAYLGGPKGNARTKMYFYFTTEFDAAFNILRDIPVSKIYSGERCKLSEL